MLVDSHKYYKEQGTTYLIYLLTHEHSHEDGTTHTPNHDECEHHGLEIKGLLTHEQYSNPISFHKIVHVL